MATVCWGAGGEVDEKNSMNSNDKSKSRMKGCLSLLSNIQNSRRVLRVVYAPSVNKYQVRDRLSLLQVNSSFILYQIKPRYLDLKIHLRDLHNLESYRIRVHLSINATKLYSCRTVTYQCYLFLLAHISHQYCETLIGSDNSSLKTSSYSIECNVT